MSDFNRSIEGGLPEKLATIFYIIIVSPRSRLLSS